MKRVFLLVAAFVLGSACKSGSTTPTPAAVLNLAGTWTVTSTRPATFPDSSCPPVPASVTYTLQVAQDGSTLTATATPAAPRPAATYAGGATQTGATLGASAFSRVTGFQCANGTTGDLQVESTTISISSVSGNVATGTEASRYTVYASGTQTIIGLANPTNTITMTR